MNKRRYIKLMLAVICHFLSPSFPVEGQEQNIATIIITIAEEMAAGESDPALAELYVDILYELSENPVDINKGDPAETGRLFFLSEFRVKTLCDYVRESGPVASLNELALIPGFDYETVELVSPFIVISRRTSSPDDSAKVRNTLMSNIIIPPAEKLLPGHIYDMKALVRYRFTAGKVSGGVTLENDAGEKSGYTSPLSADFRSCHIMFTGSGLLKKLIAGDFSARAGLGIALNTSLRSGFSLTSPGNLSGRNEIRPYTSSDENNFFRGIAVTAGKGRGSLTLFTSSNRIDATLSTSQSSGELFVKSLYTSGYHTTQVLLAKKDILRENVTGINITADFDKFRSGITYLNDRFTIPFSVDSSNPENIHDFRGSNVNLISFHYSWLIGRAILAAEACNSINNGWAFVQTASLRPADRLAVNAVYRFFSPGFTSFHGRGPGIGTYPVNEEGIGAGFTFEAAKHLFVSAGAEMRRRPWLSYRNSSSSPSVRREVRIRFIPGDRVSLELQYFYRRKYEDKASENGIALPQEMRSGSLRLSARYSPISSVSLLSRVDYRHPGSSGGRGVLLLQDVTIRLPRHAVSFWFRYCIFDTESFSSGIYTWENDLLHSFSIPVLYGCGTRCYLMVKWEPFSWSDLRLKYGYTTSSRESAADETVNEIKFQLILRF